MKEYIAKEDYEQALEWVKKISKYGEYINGNRNWSDNANKFIPFLENAIEKAIRKEKNMKEYICKEDIDLKRNCKNVECWDCSFGNAEKGCSLDNLPTVTQEDICREWELDVLKNIEIGIESTGHSDQYSTGFCNALIWLRACITGEKPEFLEMEQGE